MADFFYLGYGIVITILFCLTISLIITDVMSRPVINIDCEMVEMSIWTGKNC